MADDKKSKELDQSSPRARAAAIGDLAAALREDFKGWDAEREAWAKEKAELEARASCYERQVADLKQELKRLGHTEATVKEKNVVLLERNGTLERRNAKMRQHNKAIVEKNRKLLSMMKRELGGGDSDASGEGSNNMSTLYPKKSTSSSHGAENTRTVSALAPEHCSAHPEDTVPRRNDGPQKHSDVEPGDEEYIATPGRAHREKHLVAGGDGVGTVVEDVRRPQDREETPIYNANGETSGGDSNAKTKEQRERRRAVAARVEVSRSARSSGNHVLLSRVPLGTSTRPSNLSSSDKRLLAKSNGSSSSSSSSSSSNQRKKFPPRLTLGAREGRSQEIVEVSRDMSRRRVGRPSSAPRHAVSRRSEGVAFTSDTKMTPHASGGGDGGDNSPTRESIIAGEKHAVFSPGFQGVQQVEDGKVKNEGVNDGEGDKKQQQRRRKKRDEVPTVAGRHCEWKLFQSRRSDSGGESNDEVSSVPVWGRVEGGWWKREGTGDGSSGIPKTTTRDGVYAPLAMATVHSPKKNGSSARLREQQQPKHEGGLNRQRERERGPERPLPKDPPVETCHVLVDVTSTPAEEKTKATAADADGCDDHALGDGGEGNSRPVLPDTANVRTDVAHRAKVDPRWQENGVGKVPGARSERKRPVPRSTVEDDVDGEELLPPPRRKHRPEKLVKTNEESGKPIGSEVRGDGTHEERESTAGDGDVGTAAAGQRSFVFNPYHGGSGEGKGERGNEGREKGVPQRPQQKYKYQEVVRDRAKRAAMKGHGCEECEAYLAAVGGSPGEREALLNKCSRHKHTEANGRPQDTPEGFWDLSFADSVRSNVTRGRESRGQQRRNQQPHQQRQHEPNGVGGGGGMGGLAIGDGSEEFSNDGSTLSTLGF